MIPGTARRQVTDPAGQTAAGLCPATVNRGEPAFISAPQGGGLGSLGRNWSREVALKGSGPDHGQQRAGLMQFLVLSLAAQWGPPSWTFRKVVWVRWVG